MDGANGQTGGKNRSSTFVLTSFICFGMFNIFQYLVVHACRREMLDEVQKKNWSLNFETAIFLSFNLTSILGPERSI